MSRRSGLRPSRRFLAPEVIQTSAMDCGPATLKTLLEGYGVPVSYGRLREACHTDVDGTSIDTVEELAGALGLRAEQVMLPADFVLLRESAALPAVAVVTSPLGATHFVVVWRRLGPFVQVMDPARGRLWMRHEAFLRSLYVHSTSVSADAWRAWAGTGEFLNPLRRRLRAAGLGRHEAEQRMARASSDPSWRSLATLDAGARMAASLRGRGALTRAAAVRVLRMTQEGAGAELETLLPARYWSARADARLPDGEIRLQGAVMVRVSGRADARDAKASPVPSPELAAALAEPPAAPLRHVLSAARADGLFAPAVAVTALLIAAAGVLLEAVLLRGVLETGSFLRTPEQGLAAGLVLATFAAIMLLLEFGLGSAERRTGRHVEARLRMAFFAKLPRLADAYFQSRPLSDMAERSHAVHLLRNLPQLGVRMLRVAMELAVTTAAIAWLDPRAALPALAAAAAGAGVPLLGTALLAERDLRVRTHAGAMGRFHLDALLGRRAIDAHGAGPVVEREHEALLGEWARASVALQRGTVAVEGVQMLVGFGLAGWILFGHLAGQVSGATLLLAYWVLNLPALGYELALHAREYPVHRSAILRLIEPLAAPEPQMDAGVGTRRVAPDGTGARVELTNVSVRVAGHRVLEAVDLAIPAGSHVAIVGASGAGKSTLLGLLLGWHRPEDGRLAVDGEQLSGPAVDALRQRTAWIDPEVRVWNQSLLDNLLYGSDNPESIGQVLESAGLLPVVARLPDGLSTRLGDGGALLSAGEAQRVRIGRAMLKPAADLVILDEPFAGLERDRRRNLLAGCRQRWTSSTLLYVTHDMYEARSFDRVIVLDRGRVVEDGDPRLLVQMASSRYRRLLQAQDAAHARFGTDWQRVRFDDGRFTRDIGAPGIEQTA